VHAENFLQPRDMTLGLRKVLAKRLLKLRVGRFLDHLRERFHELLLRVVDVLQLMHEEIIERLDILGENPHGLSFSNVFELEPPVGWLAWPKNVELRAKFLIGKTNAALAKGRREARKVLADSWQIRAERRLLDILQHYQNYLFFI
jgi:hypothetical protein